MNLAWVRHTEDPLFADLERGDRLVLYLVFVREYTWEKLADALTPRKSQEVQSFMPRARPAP